MEKQTVSDWKIAKSYWFSSFVVGLLVTMVPMIVVSIVSGSVNTVGKGTGLISTIFAAISLLGVWLGAMYAGKSIAKKYLIKNKENIAINALALNLGISLFLATGGLFFSMIPGAMEGLGSLTYTDLGIGSVEACATTLVYLYTALKYIKVNS